VKLENVSVGGTGEDGDECGTPSGSCSSLDYAIKNILSSTSSQATITVVGNAVLNDGVDITGINLQTVEGEQQTIFVNNPVTLTYLDTNLLFLRRTNVENLFFDLTAIGDWGKSDYSFLKVSSYYMHNIITFVLTNVTIKYRTSVNNVMASFETTGTVLLDGVAVEKVTGEKGYKRGII
jgi:hypothetical protein